MNVFITGASGFLGTNLSKQLLAQGHEVTAMILPSESSDVFNFIDNKNSFKIVRSDITERASLEDVFNGHDAIIHLAATVGYGVSWELCQKINVDGTANVVTEAVRQRVPRIIHMSSVSVYGRYNEDVITEDTPFKKINDPYGDTKIDSEIIMRQICQDNSIDLTILRPTVIYGKGEKKFFPKLMDNLLSGKAKFIGDGKNRVDLIHISDVVNFIISILSDTRSYGQAYNLANDKSLNWEEMLNYLSDLAKIPRPQSRIAYPLAFAVAWGMEIMGKFSKKEPRLNRYSVRVVGKHYDYSHQKSIDQLGFIPQVDLRTGLADCLKNYQRN